MRAGGRECRRLPPELFAALDGRELEARTGFTLELSTVDPSGWPRTALLSVGEVLALDEGHLRMALWPSSHTTANLSRTARAALSFVHDGAWFTVLLRALRLAELEEPAPRAVFDAFIHDVRSDQVPYAILRTGIRFDLVDEKAVLERWRATLVAMAVRAKGIESSPIRSSE